jgi:hypothetical protein
MMDEKAINFLSDKYNIVAATAEKVDFDDLRLDQKDPFQHRLWDNIFILTRW